MSRASVYSIRSGNRRLPNQAGKVLCVLITLAFGTSLAQALHSGAAFVGGLKLVYSSGDGDLCGISQVPEIDPATGGSALSLVAGVLAMIENRRRRAMFFA